MSPPLPHRLGPRPLPLHLLTALTLTQPWLIACQLSNSVWQNSSAPHPNQGQPNVKRWQELANAAKSLPAGSVDTALAQAALNRLGAFIQGVRRYRDAPVVRSLPAPPVLWQEGSTRLLDFGPVTGQPLFVVPSLINRWHVLDLSAERSLLRWLSGQGFRPLLVDWDTPSAVELTYGFDDYLQRLARCLRELQDEYAMQAVPIIGYCLGGTMAVALAARHPSYCRALVTLAAPWDFHAPDAGIAERAKDILQGIRQAGFGIQRQEPYPFPTDALQAIIALMQPAAVVEKFVKFAERPTVDESFVLLEDWLNDGVPLTAKVTAELFGDLYQHNVTGRQNWRLPDKNVRCPVLMVVPEADRIVPPASAAALARFLPQATVLAVPLGHVGMIVGREAKQKTWQPLRDWLLRLESK